MTTEANHPHHDPQAEAEAHAERMNPPRDARGRSVLDPTDPAQNARLQIRTAIDTLADALAEHRQYFDPDHVADDLNPLHVVLDHLYKSWVSVPENARRLNLEIASREQDAIAAGLIQRAGQRYPDGTDYVPPAQESEEGRRMREAEQAAQTAQDAPGAAPTGEGTGTLEPAKGDAGDGGEAQAMRQMAEADKAAEDE